MFNPEEKLYQFCPQCKNSLTKKLIENKMRLYCNRCGFIFWNNPRPVVSAIISKDNSVLLIKRANLPLKDFWCLPGGVIDYEESPEEAVSREVKEETGLEINFYKLAGVYQIDNDPRGIAIDIIYSTSLEKEEQISLSKEHSLYKFFPIKDLPKLIAYKHREVINGYFK